MPLQADIDPDGSHPADDDPDVIVLGSPTAHEEPTAPASSAPVREDSPEPTLVSQSGFSSPLPQGHRQAHGLKRAPVQPNVRHGQHRSWDVPRSFRTPGGAGVAAVVPPAAADAAAPGMQLHAGLQSQPKQPRQTHILVPNQTFKPRPAASAQPQASMAAEPGSGQNHSQQPVKPGFRSHAQPEDRLGAHHQQQHEANGHVHGDEDDTPTEAYHSAEGETMILIPGATSSTLMNAVCASLMS